jgi:Tol biopolymer transport system component
MGHKSEPLHEAESHGLVAGRFPYGLAALLVGVMLLGAAAGCDSGTKTHAQTSTGAHVDVVAKSARLLQGRRLALSLGTSQIRDILVLSRGRLVQVSKSVRVAIGGTGCYGSAYGSGSGPCYQWAEPFALSPDGRQLAFLLGYPVEGVANLSDALIVSRSDGSHARQVLGKVFICALCAVSTPSWDKGSRSFVIAVESAAGPSPLTSLSKIFRITARSGEATMLSPPGTRTHSEGQPAVSPDGSRIAFLRRVKRGPADVSFSAAAALVYMMSPNGGSRARLPLPPRSYVDLWWCGSSTQLCVDSPTDTLDARANVYRLNLQSRRVTHLRHWAGASYGGLSTDGTFALMPRKTGHGWQLLVGPVGGTGAARLAPLLTTKAERNPYYDFSVSEPQTTG